MAHHSILEFHCPFGLKYNLVLVQWWWTMGIQLGNDACTCSCFLNSAGSQVAPTPMPHSTSQVRMQHYSLITFSSMAHTHTPQKQYTRSNSSSSKSAALGSRPNSLCSLQSLVWKSQVWKSLWVWKSPWVWKSLKGLEKPERFGKALLWVWKSPQP